MWSFQFPGYAFSSDATNAVSYVGNIVAEVVVPALVAAQTGTMTNKVDANTGDITLSTGHGILTADVVDVYFPAGVRYGMTATVAVNVVTVDLGAGVDLPVNTTACTIVKQTEIEVNFDGDDARIVGILYRNPSDTAALANLDLQDVGDASIVALGLVHEKVNGADDKIYDIANGDSNVFSGNRITHGAASHDSLFAATMYILVGITAP